MDRARDTFNHDCKRKTANDDIRLFSLTCGRIAISRISDDALIPHFSPAMDSLEFNAALNELYPENCPLAEKKRKLLAKFYLAEDEAISRRAKSAALLQSIPSTTTDNISRSTSSSNQLIVSERAPLLQISTLAIADSSQAEQRQAEEGDIFVSNQTVVNGCVVESGPGGKKRKRHMSEKQRNDARIARKRGACPGCRRLKKKCIHVLSTPSTGVSVPGDLAPIVNQPRTFQHLVRGKPTFETRTTAVKPQLYVPPAIVGDVNISFAHESSLLNETPTSTIDFMMKGDSESRHLSGWTAAA
jgi:hypothetical protein